MRLNEVMETDVITIAPTETVAQARSLMETHNIRHLVVFDQGVKGVVTDRDVHAMPLPGQSETELEWIENTRVEDVMSSPVATLSSTDTVKKAANVMRGRKVGSVVIVDDGKLVGIVSQIDLLEALSNTGTSSKQRVSVRARGNKRRR